MQASSWLKTFHLCLLKCLRTKFFLGTTAMRWLSVASQTTAGLNTQAITLDLNPLCSLYKKNTTAWVNELVGMRKILEDQAEISEDEILGVRAPGLTPGFNAQYEVDIACHTFPDFNFPCHFYSQYPGADRLWFHLGLQPRRPPASDPCVAVHL